MQVAHEGVLRRAAPRTCIWFIHPFQTRCGDEKGVLSNIQGFESLFEHLAKFFGNFWVECTYRAGIIVRKILERCACFYSPMWFATLLIIHIPTHGAEIPRRNPLIKSPLANFAFSLHTADGAYIALREILKRSSRGYTVMRFTSQRRIDVAADLAFITGLLCHLHTTDNRLFSRIKFIDIPLGTIHSRYST